jgi:hypothetical protein
LTACLLQSSLDWDRSTFYERNHRGFGTGLVGFGVKKPARA